jgi:nucleoside-diphosphate-sugar epimerase
MRLLLVNVSGVLRRPLADALARKHEGRVLETDPRDLDVAVRETSGIDTIVCGLPDLQPGSSDPLPAFDRASRGVYNLLKSASAAGARRFVLLSSLRPFERYPLDQTVTEFWAPRPTTAPADLIVTLTEAVVREASHTLPIKTICLRLATVVDRLDTADPRTVHVDDVVQAVERALVFEDPSREGSCGWWAFHIVGAGRTRFPLGLANAAGRATALDMPTLGYLPVHDVAGTAPVTATNVQPHRRFTTQLGGGARKVVIFGAGGPLAAITARALEQDHVLRLCDLRPLTEIIAHGQPQSRGAPVPRLLGPPHEMREVDVTNYDQVLEAMRDMDAVINMTVMRHDPVEAFRVNTLGAYNVIGAAVECGIRRVVQTGPQLVTNTMPGAYWADFDLSASVPPRPGVGLYGISKFLGNEIVRIFAQEYDLEVPTLVFGPFTNPDDCEPDELGGYPFLVSWDDAAEAVRGALRAPAFPRPFEIFHIVADLPHGKYRNDRTKHILHWQPRDNLDVHWRRSV